MNKESALRTNVRQNAVRLWDYVIKTMNGMALGLFSTLIIGTIIGTIGRLIPVDVFADHAAIQNILMALRDFLNALSNLLKSLTGVGIGIGVGFSLKLEGLKLIAAGIAGGIATLTVASTLGKPGDPVVAYLVVVAACEVTRLILRRKTPVDIILVPFLSGIVAYLAFLVINQPISQAMTAIGNFITWATSAQPFLMGVIISVVMGIILTAPTSSAAIAIAISLQGIAGGASVVGCCVQMLGFAVQSRKDNNIGTVLSVGLGTSMLQFKNILKKPVIWLPTIIVSAILGPVATLIFKTQSTPIGSGMGTSGLVGQIGTLDAMGSTPSAWLSILILEILLPIVLVWAVDLYFRKKGWIKPGDLKL